MTQTTFRAMVVEETDDGRFRRRITDRTVSDLPKGNLLIKVHYSSLNYKDALSASGNRGVTRRYPHTPGVDAAGEVVESGDSRFKPGDPVIVTGFDMGMNTAGGFGQYIRVPAEWAVALPKGLTLETAMMIGTAGLTAAICIDRLETAGITPDSGDILVTGATGGVGSMATAILSHSGYSVTAVTGKSEAVEFLTGLGAKQVLHRQKVLDAPPKPLLPARHIGVVDSVGGDILSYAVRTTRYGGTITACGNAASGDLNLTVYPFILRGVQLIGIDSAECAIELRAKLWRRLGGRWRFPGLENFVTEIGLDDLDERIEAMLAGGVTGRYLVNMNK